jgi:hypothetical protein
VGATVSRIAGSEAQGARKLGHLEELNITIEFRSAADDPASIAGCS